MEVYLYCIYVQAFIFIVWQRGELNNNEIKKKEDTILDKI